MSDTPAGTSLDSIAKRAGTWLLVEGVILLVLGGLAIFLPLIAGLAIDIFIGWLLLFGGIVGLLSTFSGRRMPGFAWSLISAIAAIVAGVLLIGWPARGLFSLTLVLITFFAADGLVSIAYALSHRSQVTARWGWILASGIVTLALAVIIALGLPGSASWAVGLIVGIDLAMAGASLIAVGAGIRAAP